MASSGSARSIPPSVGTVLRPVLPGLADETIAAIAREVPGYRSAMEGQLGEIVRKGVEISLGRFVDSIEHPDGQDLARRDTYVKLGRGELHAGRDLETLLAAYRVGARLSWRRFVDACVAAQLEPEVIYRLGEAIFEYIDALSAASAEGYAAEQMAEAGQRRRLRRRLVTLLGQSPPPDEEVIRTAAVAASWELPRTLAAVVCDVPDDDDPEVVEAAAEQLARRLGQGAVGAAVGGLACALVPDPDAPRRRRQIEAALEGMGAALGTSEPWDRAWISVSRALATHRLLGERRVAVDGLAVADEHLATLLLASDPILAADLAATRLAPLLELPEGSRERLIETLRAWLDRPGQVQAVGEALGVHPQTVRYRVRQLKELFGDALEDPDARFELALALRV
ncbi:MAG: Transcriptional regulator, CdaR-family [uncultured Solirubrobacteraceae bacterium]|uniref:Transcriptional regulator, CdaR-family n=1 Tax=uncultured Solirubrobacteraceae bacterium TaxID=1162706 RepID=A0A6J4R8Z2_9ACTN|nr:MAG: Transcriptional regulator, CdaR-family [uncultured Solirubrobacteraceae bacterium]